MAEVEECGLTDLHKRRKGHSDAVLMTEHSSGKPWLAGHSAARAGGVRVQVQHADACVCVWMAGHV